MKKKLLGTAITMLLAASIVSITTNAAFAAPAIDHLAKAESLSKIGFMVKSPKGFELDQSVTRLEAATMLMRFLGKEGELKTTTFNHPFTDVPAASSQLIGYLFENNFMTNNDTTLFGPNEKMTAQAYMTMLLHALDYSAEAGDYGPESALEFAQKLGILTAKDVTAVKSQGLMRDELALLTFNALGAKHRTPDGTTSTTLQKPHIASLIEVKKWDPLTLYQGGLIQLDLARTYLTKTIAEGNIQIAPAKDYTRAQSEDESAYISLQPDFKHFQVNFGLTSDNTPGGDTVAKLDFYLKGKWVMSNYTRPLSSKDTDSGYFAQILDTPFDQVHYRVFEINDFELKQITGPIAYKEISASKVKDAAALMAKASYVTKLTASEIASSALDNQTLSLNGIKFSAATHNFSYRPNSTPFVIRNYTMGTKPVFVNAYKGEDKITGKPPKFNIEKSPFNYISV